MDNDFKSRLADLDFVSRLNEENEDLRTALDKTEYAKALLKQKEEFSLLLDASKLIVSELDVNKVLDLVAQKARDIVDADLVVVPILNEVRDRYTYMAAAGADAEHVLGEGFATKVGMCGWVLQNERSLLYGENTPFWMDEKTSWEEGQQSAVLVPLFGRQGIIGGVSALGKKGGGSFTRHDLDLLTMFANQISAAIEKAFLFQQISKEVEERKQAEEALGRSEERFKAVFDNSRDAIGVSRAGVHVFANPAYLALFGFKPDTELKGKPILDVIAPGHRGQVQDYQLGRSRNEATVSLYETKGRRVDGSEFDMEVQVSVYQEDGTNNTLAVLRDITERKRAEEELKALNESLELRIADRTQELSRAYEFNKTVMDSMNDPISIVDVVTHKIIGANAAFLREYGLQEAEVAGKTCYEITHRRTEPCLPPDDICPLADTVATGGHSVVEHIHCTSDGKERYVEVLTSPIRDEHGIIVQAIHIQRDITDRRRTQEQIRVLAYYDNLTGLPNRTFFKELLTRALTYAKRSSKLMAALFIDLDSFKRVNDTLGHAVGDELLKSVAERLSKCVRQTDYIARPGEEAFFSMVSRLGGDEFVVLLNDITQGHDAAVVANRILKEVSQPFLLSGHEMFISTSIGISLYPADGEDAETLLKNADTAMYSAKEQGKNKHLFFASSMNAKALERFTTENELHRALERKELLLYYQPKFDVRSGTITGFEALIRWKHPEKGLVSPAVFIPLAEETGLIIPIGEWVLKTACLHCKAWQALGFAPLPVSVNISKRQFEQHKLVETVMTALREAELSPESLELEITESMIMQNPERAIAILHELKAKGIRTSLDDFGTGYSSLSYLRRFPLDSLKIDRSFVMHVTTSPDDAAIASAILAMAQALKLKVVAEGVETDQQLAFLRGLRCDEAQGFLFSKPLPAEQCAEFITKAFSRG